MPLYEFECPKCHEEFEELIRNTEAVKAVACPKCGHHKVKKKLSTFAPKMSGSVSASFGGATCAPDGT